MSTVAIVMATYNGERFVAEQIDSILASTYQDFELFIFDDCSKDNTMTILRNYEEQYPSKIHVSQNEENLGLTINFLRAVRKTTMDYIMFCDQDDVWKPNKIGVTLKRVRHMEAQIGREKPIAVFTDAVVVDKDLSVLKNSYSCSHNLNPRKTDLPHILMENKLIGCTVMMNAALRKVLLSCQLPNKARYHDWWVALIAASMGKIGYVNEGTLLYRQHGGNIVGGDDFFSYVRNRIASLHEQKEALRSLYRQADEFRTIYHELLPEECREIITRFANLEQYNFIARRLLILHCGYLKTGLIRNLGLIFVI